MASSTAGYSAKYGTYSLLDVERNKIVLHFEVLQVYYDFTMTYVRVVYFLKCLSQECVLNLQSNEVGSSYRMEIPVLPRGLDFLNHNNVEVFVLVTDCHAQVKCFVQKHKAETDHEYDVRHMAKGTLLNFLNYR